MASPGGWFQCRVVKAGPANDSKIYIRLATSGWERWFFAIEAFEKEMLATALTAISTGYDVDALLETTDEYGRINRLYVRAAAPPPQPPPPPQTTTVPDVRETPLPAARQAIQDAGLTASVTGPTVSGAWVYSQTPNAGQVVNVGSTVSLVTRTGPIP